MDDPFRQQLPFYVNQTLPAAQRRALYAAFIKPHSKAPGLPLPSFTNASELAALAAYFQPPQLLLLKKHQKHWQLVEAFFDYQGRFFSSSAVVD